MGEVSYSKAWFRAKKRPIEEWPEARAQAAHEGRKPYVALLKGRDGRLNAFVEFNDDYAGVGFLDSRLREELSYQFQERKPGQLFLTMATYRGFEGDSDRVANGTTYTFQEDGGLIVTKEDFQQGTQSTKESQVDVSGNWEAYPTFGDYEGLAKRERG